MTTAEVFEMMVYLIPLIFFSVLSFWHLNAVLFLLTAGISVMLGLSWYNNFETSPGLTIALVLVAYGVVCICYAFRCLFIKHEGEEDVEE